MAHERTPARRLGRGMVYLLAVGCLFGAIGERATAAPTVQQMLLYKPRQEGINYTTPAPEVEARCKVDPLKGGSGSGWILRDEAGLPLRVFFDSNNDGKVDVWSYYKDGTEVYREIDTTFAGKPNQYRWLNAGGMKWGVDEARDGHIKAWKVISPEEVSQELLAAIMKKDTARFQALLVTEDDIKALGMPADMAATTREAVKKAPAKFEDTHIKMTKVTPKSSWLHLETAAPYCLPADQTGARMDIVRHSKGTVLIDVGNGNEWMQTGEMIKVGEAWKLVSGPAPGTTTDAPVPTVNAATQKLFDELAALDKVAPPSSASADIAVVTHHLKRADLLEKVIGAVAESEREQWIRQLADSLSTASQSSPVADVRSFTRLTNLVKQLATSLPTHNLTAYVTFREMQAEYSAKLSKPDAKFDAVQKDWIDRLSKFVTTFPKAEDTPDALLQLGMVSEFLGKDVEAKNWYTQLVKNFPGTSYAKKAEGANDRLDLEGKPLKLAGASMKDPATVHDVAQMQGKIVIVYYWASWNTQTTGDFTKLKTVLDTNKGVELFCVNLDTKLSEAQEFARKAPLPGVHVHQEGGLEGKLATDYGVMVLPTVFVVGKDGKVVSRNAQVSTLEEEIKKLTK